MGIEEIYREYLDFVFRICASYTHDRSAAEDLTQEVFVKVSRRMENFRGEARLSTWIYSIAVNCCIDYLRRQKRENRLHAEYLDDQVVRNLSPEGDRVLAKVDLEKILSPLRPSIRQILFLTFAEGLS